MPRATSLASDKKKQVTEGSSEPTSGLRAAAAKVQSFLEQDPPLRRRLVRAKQFRRAARFPGNYDLTARCNLLCEGCYFFEGEDYKHTKEETDLSKWRTFFKEQSESGITFANLAGAEAALEPRRLEAAFEFLPRGSVFTNGTIRIDPSLNYTVVVSLWGDEATTADFRGGGVFWKALNMYRGDHRARMLFTVHARNIDQILPVTRIVSDYGTPLSFNYYSPTESYLGKISSDAPNDDKFFRLSTQEDNFILTSDMLVRARDAIDEAINRYPETVIHTHSFNHAVTVLEGIYKLDESGIATNCAGRNFRWHQSYRVDLKPSDAKCCTPNVSCKTCRLNAIALGSLMFRQKDFLDSIDKFRGWLDICDQWGRSHLLDTDPAWLAGIEHDNHTERAEASSD